MSDDFAPFNAAFCGEMVESILNDTTESQPAEVKMFEWQVVGGDRRVIE